MFTELRFSESYFESCIQFICCPILGFSLLCEDYCKSCCGCCCCIPVSDKPISKQEIIV